MREQHDVVPRDEPGVYRRLVLVDVESGPAEMPRRERRDERGLVDERPARGVEQDRAALHRGECARVERVTRLARERRVKGNDVGLGEQLRERNLPRERVCERVARREQHAHPECVRAMRDGLADPSEAEEPERSSVHFATEQEARRPRRELPGADDALAFPDAAAHREEQGHRQVGRRGGQHVGRVRHDDAALLRGGEVDVVHADRAVRDEPHLRKTREERAIDRLRELHEDRVRVCVSCCDRDLIARQRSTARIDDDADAGRRHRARIDRKFSRHEERSHAPILNASTGCARRDSLGFP